MTVPVETAAVVLGCVYAVVLGVLRLLTLHPGAGAVGGISGTVVSGCVRVNGRVVLGGASEGRDGDLSAGGGVSLHWLVKQLLVLVITIGILEEVLLVGVWCSPASLTRLHQLNPNRARYLKCMILAQLLKARDLKCMILALTTKGQ